VYLKQNSRFYLLSIAMYFGNFGLKYLLIALIK